MSVVWLDTETTGLDSDRHDIWDIAIIKPNGYEFQKFPRPDLSTADPTALRLNRFYERTAPSDDFHWSEPRWVAREVARLIAGKHVVGAVPDFDARFLDRWLRKHGQAPAHHYHLIDVETLAVGWLLREPLLAGERAVLDLPWRSDDLSLLCDVEPPSGDERHTALGDARWVKCWYEALTGGGGE